MKKITLSILIVSLLVACTESTVVSNEQNINKETQGVELSVKLKQIEPSVKIPIDLFTNKNKDYILQITDNEMYDAGGYEDIWIKPIAFRPDGYDVDFIYAQIDFIKGEVTSTAFVIFYPQVEGYLDEAGFVSSETYQVIPNEDHPCVVCKLENITVEQPKDIDYPVIKGVFIDRIDNSKQIIKYMDYNFQEMNIYWNDYYYFDNVEIKENSKYDKKAYSKSDLVGHWFQPHFAVRTLDFKSNGYVAFNDGSVENEDVFFNGKWAFKSDDKKAIVIVFDEGTDIDLKMPLILSGGLFKSSFMISNDEEQFAKNYE